LVNTIHRGDVFDVDWNPSRGSEQSGIRPSVVIQNDTGNLYSSTTVVTDVIVATITSSEHKAYPFMVKIDQGECGLSPTSCVNLSAIMTIDKSRLLKKWGQLPPNKMAEIDIALKISLGLK
jgi:mRNA interferase MazF